VRLAHRLGLRRSQFLGIGILACIGAGQIRVAWLALAVAVIGVVSIALGFSGLFVEGHRRRREKGVSTRP